MKRIVIIGGCAAGPKTAAKSKRLNPENEVIMYTQEDLVSYSACGIPYYVGGSFDNVNNLIIRTPEVFEAQGVHVHVNHKCTKVLPDEKMVIINDERVPYDELVLATGAIVAPIKIKNQNLENIFHIRNLHDGEAVKEKIKISEHAIIIGGGYIGIEMLEAFIKNNLKVTIIEATDQMMPLFDKEMADLIEEYILERDKDKVTLIKNDMAEEFLGEKEFIGIRTKSGKEIMGDFCVVATGVVPNVELAKDCGVEIGKSGAIKVSNRMRTNIPNIWAAGDCTEKNCLITKRHFYISLGSIANKEGRVCAININGGDETFDGILSSAVTRYFDYTMSTTGLSEKIARRHSVDINIDPIAATITKADRAGYMPEMREITIKLVADRRSGEVLGAQAVGSGDADKRINIVSSAIQGGLNVDELLHLDLTYAPPYGTAIDPLHEAVYKIKKLMGNKWS